MTDSNSKPSLIEENVGDENPTNENSRINKRKQKRAANQIKIRRDAGDFNVGLTEGSAETVGGDETETPAGDQTVTAEGDETETVGDGETVTAAGGAREVVAAGAREIFPVVPNVDILLLQNFVNNALTNIPRFFFLSIIHCGL